jgi:hypothetical protein
MPSNMTLIWIGALLVMGGLLFTAAKALGRGRLSEAPSPRSGALGASLEPRGPGARLRLEGLWPGLAVSAFGALLLLAGAAEWLPTG